MNKEKCWVCRNIWINKCWFNLVDQAALMIMVWWVWIRAERWAGSLGVFKDWCFHWLRNKEFLKALVYCIVYRFLASGKSPSPFLPLPLSPLLPPPPAPSVLASLLMQSAGTHCSRRSGSGTDSSGRENKQLLIELRSRDRQCCYSSFTSDLCVSAGSRTP